MAARFGWMMWRVFWRVVGAALVVAAGSAVGAFVMWDCLWWKRLPELGMAARAILATTTALTLPMGAAWIGKCLQIAAENLIFGETEEVEDEQEQDE